MITTEGQACEDREIPPWLPPVNPTFITYGDSINRRIYSETEIVFKGRPPGKSWQEILADSSTVFNWRCGSG
jgi:hypothetical protein